MSARKTLQPGDRAPEFTLPAVDREGMVALEDFRGRCAVLLGFFRGLNCPFCRRQLAQLGAVHPRLVREGVESLGIITTPLSRARLYSRFRPPKLPLASDVEGATHRLFGVPKFDVIDNDRADAVSWPASVSMAQVSELRIEARDVFSEPRPAEEVVEALNRLDGFIASDEDIKVSEAHWNQLGGLFLVDEAAIVRWCYVEAAHSPSELGSFPGQDELLSAVRELRQ